jgi:hypothetical protein
MDICIRCGGYVPPATRLMHVGEYHSTLCEDVRTYCVSCGAVYIFQDLPYYHGSESGDIKIMSTEEEDG